MRVHDSASIRCIFAKVRTPATDGQSAFMVKCSRDDGATLELPEYMDIAQKHAAGRHAQTFTPVFTKSPY